MTARSPVLERWYDLQGIRLVVRSEAPAVIAAMDRRLESFRSGELGPADLHLEFLVRADGDDPRLCPPPGPSRPVYEAPGGDIAYHTSRDTIYADIHGLRLLCAAGDGMARMESDDYAGRRLYLATHALATVCLIELLKRRGRFNLHAACLARDGRGVLLAGASGAGKSTIAIALVRAGLAFLSDDMVYIEPASEGVRMIAFPDAIGLTDQTVARFPELGPMMADPVPEGFPKRLVRMHALFGAEQLWSCVPQLLLFPQVVAEGPSRLEALDPKEALLRLVPDVLLTEPVAAQAHLRALAALLANVDCRVLRAGPDLNESVQRILDVA